jgi:hypothetical protein
MRASLLDSLSEDDGQAARAGCDDPDLATE